ncbi:Endonuclease/exonuclease/phosphatase [Glomus cerebriforme]|uniref:Endonuclease/exonuclease/phosphatase n=1 Tax=Glomus cerebriforme TaxID=658196 RepID=A0A397S6N1_9GLOM|nr:Endonuclease/exonuclease/phosphatase [Glomus cerebriforme]
MPPKKRDKDDAEYVPSDDDEETEEEEEIATESTEPTKKTTKTKKSRRKGSEEYQSSDSEVDESEEDVIDTAEATEPSSSRKGKKKKKSPTEDPNSNDDDKGESALKGQTKKFTQKIKEKKEEIFDKGKSSSSQIKSPKKKGGQISSTEGEIGGSTELDDLLKKFPLPSSSRPQVFNKYISLIGSINIQAFGTKKSSNHIIMRIITDILRHYDIILCQEIRANEDIIQQLTNEVSTPATPYAYVASHPIGRSTYQERYVFLYRKNEWKVLEDYVIDDDDALGDKFIREPYVVRFQHLKKTNVRVTLVGCHTQPENALEEIKTLVNTVYMDVRKKLQRDNVQEKRQLDRGIGQNKPNKILSFLWRYLCCYGCFGCCNRCFGCCDAYSSVSTRDFSDDLTPSGVDTNEPIIMMGDLNAAGSYVNKSQRAELDTLLKKNNLMWGIQHNADTTVADGPDTAYDRFIFETANERRWIGNSRIWRFDDGWLKGNVDVDSVKKAAKRVTDHYPIEFELKLKE